MEEIISYVIDPARTVQAERGSPGIQGIVTSFVIKTYPQVGGVWVSTVILDAVIANCTEMTF